MDIGRPKRILEVDPVSAPVPETIAMPALPGTTREPSSEPSSRRAGPARRAAPASQEASASTEPGVA